MKFRKPKVHFRNTRIGCIENITLVRITTERKDNRTNIPTYGEKFKNVERQDKKKASSSRKKRKPGTSGDKHEDKRNKGHERGTNKAEAGGKGVQRSDRG